MDNNFSAKFTLLVRTESESTDAAFLARSGRIFHSGIERGRNDDLPVAVLICYYVPETVLAAVSPGWAFLAQQSCKFGISLTIDDFLHACEYEESSSPPPPPPHTHTHTNTSINLRYNLGGSQFEE